MEMNFCEETWNGFLEKLSSYEGSITEYCKKNNMTRIILSR